MAAGTAGLGLGGYKRTVEKQTNYNNQQIQSAFQDLESLKERGRGMVQVAEQIKSKLARKELDGNTDEMREI